MTKVIIDGIEYAPVAKPTTIQFPELGLEMMAEDLCKDVTMKQAEKAIAKLGDGRRLPTEYELIDMVSIQEGDTQEAQVKNLIDKTGLDGGYWTSTKWNGSGFVIRGFNENDRNRGRDFDDFNDHVRPIRPL